VNPTDDQKAEQAWFRAQVAVVNPRARVVRDSEGWPFVPGSVGCVETALDRTLRAVFTSRRVVDRLLAIPGVRRHQMGDTEARMLFPADDPACLRAVLSVIRPRVRRVLSVEQRAALVQRGVGQRFAAPWSPSPTTAAPVRAS
jgi:hypothetical protein